MNLQDSILKLTFNPGGTNLVLLNYGSKLADGPVKFPQANGRDIVPTPDSPYPLILDTLNSQFPIKFTVVDDSPTSPAEAMRTVFNSLVATPSYGVKQLKIEVQGITGHYWLVQYCHLTKNEVWSQPDSRFARMMKTIEMSCAGISYV